MELTKFLKFKQNNKRIVCIDFGGSFIKVTCLEVGRGVYRLLTYALKEFNASQNTAKEIGHFLKQLIERNSITGKEVYLSISDPEWIFIKKLTLPQMPKDELLNAVKWQLKGELTFSPDESVSDLQVIREYADSEGAKRVEFFCVFAKKDIINKYVSAISACGLSPAKVSSSVFNYCGTLNSLLTNPKISAILDIGHTHSQVAIYQKNKLSFVRGLNISTGKLIDSLVGAFATEKGEIEINIEKAKEMIWKFGIPPDEFLTVGGDITTSYVISRIRPFLETMAKELKRSFEYFKSESGLGIPDVLYITGGGANLKNFDSYLAGELKIRVEKFPLPDSLGINNLDAARLARDANQLSSVIGLGLSTYGINLLPREIKSRKIELIQERSLRIAAIAIGAIFVFFWFVTNFQIRDYKKRLKIAKLHLQSVEEIKVLKQIVDSREDLINIIHTGKVPSGELLKLISALIPSTILLDELSFDQSSHNMWLRGAVTSDKDSVEKVLTDFMNNIENYKFIQQAKLISSKEYNGINSFEIECELAK